MRSIKFFILLTLFLTAFPTQPASAVDQLCFSDIPGINDCISGRFKQYWEQNGGLPVFGYPLSPEQVEETPEGTFVTQYFERQRFELHPELNAPYDVLLGRLGAEIYEKTQGDWRNTPKAIPNPQCRYFAETQQQICQPFLDYWQSHGLLDPSLDSFGRSLQLFGLPLTQPRLERNPDGDFVLTQWFERARFEDHGIQGVLLGRLGAELLAFNPLPPAEAYDIAMLNAINVERVSRGLSPLTLSEQINTAAQNHSNDMATNNFFNHTGSDGSNAGTRISRTGYQWIRWAENIAAGFTDPQAIVNAWMESESHRNNLLNPDMREIGVGYAENLNATYTRYWTVDFASR